MPFDGTPGAFNAITDVAGVQVGITTLISGEGKLVEGKGPVRTGVTAILPRGKAFDPVFAATHVLNGNGDLTGTQWIGESGFLETPILITNTGSVGVVRDAALGWMSKPTSFSRRLFPTSGSPIPSWRDVRRRAQRHVRLSRQARRTCESALDCDRIGSGGRR